MYQVNPGNLAGAFTLLEWVLFALHSMALLAGVYLAFLHKESNRLRRRLIKQLGRALLGVGLAGGVFGGLHLADVLPVARPYGLYIASVILVALVSYAAYYARSVYPKQLSNTPTSRGKQPAKSQSRPAAQQPQTKQPQSGHKPKEHSGEPSPPLPPRSRRESRRERKRKHR